MKNIQVSLKVRCVGLLLLFTCVFGSIHSQVKWKEYLVPCSGMLVSGMIDGTIESIKFHYDEGFKPHFKKIDDAVWNPDLSWRNKYKDGDPAQGPKFFGSTTAFVFTTDAYHALRTTKNLVNTGVVVFYLNKARCDLRKPRWKKILIDVLILTAARNVGFHLTYSVAFRNQRSL